LEWFGLPHDQIALRAENRSPDGREPVSRTPGAIDDQHAVAESFQPIVFGDHRQSRKVGRMRNGLIEFFKQRNCCGRVVSGKIIKNMLHIHGRCS